MLYQASRNNKGFFWDGWIIPHSVGVLSLLGCRFGRSGSSGLVGRFLRLRLSNRGLVLRVRALRTHFTSWRFHTGYGLLQIITSSIFVQNLIAFTVLFLKILFYISVLLLRTFNWKKYFSTYNTLSRKNIFLIFEFYFT